MKGKVQSLVFVLFAAACQYSPSVSEQVPPPLPPPPPPQVASGLWTLSGSAEAILSLGTDQLSQTGVVDPSIKITTPSGRLAAPGGIAFDRAGELWIVNQTENKLLGFAPGAITASGQAAATIVITSNDDAIVQPSDVAFDSRHRLWIANAGRGTLVRYDSAQLVTSGAPTPAVTITGLVNPGALSFDKSGALWVSDAVQGRVVRLSPNQLEISGEAVPTVILENNGTSLMSPRGMAFDRFGRLFVANAGNRTVVAFDPTQITRSGNPVPEIVLSSTLNSLSLPVGLAFDDIGDLWVMNADGLVDKLAVTTIYNTSAPAPAVHLVVLNKQSFRKIAFWPRPTNLPVN